MGLPEEQTGQMISGITIGWEHISSAALLGSLEVCARWSTTLNWTRAKQSLLSAIQVATATKYMKRTKLALIGYQAPGHRHHPNPFQR